MDTQVVMRPLLDKIEVKTTATAFRKIHFPHVSLNALKLYNLHLQRTVSHTVLKKSLFFSPTVQRSLVSCARKTGLLLFQYPAHLELWRLGESDGTGNKNMTMHLNLGPLLIFI